MKKMLVFLLIISCLFSTNLFKVETNPLFDVSNVDRVCFVSAKEYKNSDVESVVCGDKFFNYCTLEVAKKNLNEFKKEVVGIQFYLEEENLNSLLSKIKFQRVEQTQIDDMTILCGYSPYYQDCIFVNDKKVNVQIASCEGKIVVGFPVILTGY